MAEKREHVLLGIKEEKRENKEKNYPHQRLIIITGSADQFVLQINYPVMLKS